MLAPSALPRTIRLTGVAGLRAPPAHNPWQPAPLTLGPKPPEVTTAEPLAEQRQYLGALARRRTPVGLDADAAPLGAVG